MMYSDLLKIVVGLVKFNEIVFISMLHRYTTLKFFMTSAMVSSVFEDTYI